MSPTGGRWQTGSPAAIGLADATGPSEEIFWAVRQLFHALAEKEPIAIVFEDLHWAEPLLLDLIDDLVERSVGARLLVVCIARPEFLEQRPQWGGGKLNASVISLDALSDGEIRKLIENALGNQGVPAPEVVARLAEASGGNPLFAEQMIASLLEQGLISPKEGQLRFVGSVGDLSIPVLIQALLAARIDRLPDPQREATRSASVVGREFYLGALEDMTEPRSRGRIGDQLTELAKKQLVRRAGTTFEPEDTFGFLHMLLRDAAYDSLSKRSRAALHETFAAWLERKAGDRADEYGEILGHHLESAFLYRKELGEKGAHRELGIAAGRRLSSAGQHALARGDVVAASQLLGRAVALLTPGEDEAVTAASALFDALLDAGELGRAAAIVELVAGWGQERADDRMRARSVLIRSFLESHLLRRARGERGRPQHHRVCVGDVHRAQRRGRPVPGPPAPRRSTYGCRTVRRQRGGAREGGHPCTPGGQPPSGDPDALMADISSLLGSDARRSSVTAGRGVAGSGRRQSRRGCERKADNRRSAWDARRVRPRQRIVLRELRRT